jgi:hypothetical protein
METHMTTEKLFDNGRVMINSSVLKNIVFKKFLEVLFFEN